MAPKSLDELEQAFTHALGLDEAERDVYLAELHDRDPELCDAVGRLLLADAEDDAALRDPVAESVSRLGGVSDDRWIGKTVGVFQITERIAAGGMGVVFLGARSDGQYEQQVAIKIMSAQLLTRDASARFRAERQILANLDHPYIASLIDGGMTEEGLPYLVLDYIDGLPIDRYCDEHQLEVRDRLELFGKVCEAVDYAHRKLVVHRDLKPSNILIDGKGNPRLLDFGIAKLISAESLNHTVAMTRAGIVAMTPEYASPEQVRGEPVSVATDVYSLGVLLYKILCGRMPYAGVGDLPGSITQAILEVEPSRPSTALTAHTGPHGGDKSDREISSLRGTSTARLKNVLSGDLDNIVLAALRKQAERRYATVRQLQQDINNYLQHRPVLARGDSLVYLTGKFVRRNRWAVAAGAAFLAVVVGLTSFYTAQVTEERDRAQLAAATAARVSAFMQSLFETSDPSQSRGESITARSLLDKGAQRIDRELSDQPAIRAAMQDVMGGAYRGLGLYEQSRALLGDAIETRRGLYGDEHPEVLETLSRIAGLAHSTGEYETSERLHRESLELSRAIYGEEHSTTAMLLGRLGTTVFEQGRYEDARSLYESALEIHERTSPGADSEKAIVMHGFGWLLTNMGEFETAESMLRTSVAMLRETLGEAHPEIPAAMNHLTYVLMDTGQWDEAEITMREGLALSLRIYGEEHPDVSGDLFTLGTILQNKGEYAEAEDLYRQGLAADIKMLGEDHPYIATDKNNLAGALRAQGEYQEALVLYRESLALNQQLHGGEHPETATSMSNLAIALAELGSFDEANGLFQDAYEIRKKILGEEHPSTLSGQYIYARYLHSIDDYATSRTLFEDALEKRRRILGETHPHTAAILLRYGALLRDMGQADAAMDAVRQGLAINTEAFDDSNPAIADSIYTLATVTESNGNKGAAEELYRDALARYRGIHGAVHPQSAAVLTDLGELLMLNGQANEALPLLEEALTIREQSLPSDHWEIGVTRSVLGSCQSALGLPEAEATLEQARDLLVQARGPDSRQARLASARLAEHREARRP